MSEKLEVSKQSGPHQFLSKMCGEWEGLARTWFEPDKLADESAVRGTMRLILNGRFILHEYQGSFGGQPLEGMAIYGFHLGLQQFQSAWIDSFHNGSAIMFSEGKRGSRDFHVLGSYAYLTPETEQHWGWRTEVEMQDDNQIRLTAYNLSPEGEETKATEVVYQRVK